MKSKGGKIDWLCPHCRSPDISKCVMYGQNSGRCNESNCNTWWPWKSRIKVRADSHSKEFAKKVGVSQSVANEYLETDKKAGFW